MRQQANAGACHQMLTAVHKRAAMTAKCGRKTKQKERSRHLVAISGVREAIKQRWQQRARMQHAHTNVRVNTHTGAAVAYKMR